MYRTLIKSLPDPIAGLDRCRVAFACQTSRLSHQVLSFAICIALLSMIGSSGCKTLSLPAIDPTGNRIFTNAGQAWTPVINPHDPNNGYPSQQPAFQAPPEPPACMQGADGTEKKLCKGCLAGKGCLAKQKVQEEIRGRCGQLLLTPTRIVAPVGGEVILLAGVCGKDEFLVTNEPIEWMLAPNSVGQIVDVGDDSKGEKKSAWSKDDRPKVEKLDVDFARGRTSSAAGNITRGTANKADDLPIRKGQTWVSLTSPTEGVSKVTALAPDSDVWDKRRQTATIYWVDASWQFPGPQSAQTGREVQLITRVMRSEGFAPAEGWRVRYRSLNPEYARFLPTKAETADVEVDKNGIAAVSIVNGSSNANAPQTPFGSALVEIEIVKPMVGSENMPELPIAKGTTLVTWNAPALVLDAIGPEIAVPGQDLPYIISVANIGDVVSENTTLNVAIPTGMQVKSTTYQPDTQPTNNTLRWTIGPLPARQRFDVTLTLVASAELDARIQLEAVGTPDLRQQKVLQTLIQKPKIALQFAPRQNSTQVEVGSEAAFELLITNTGNQTINNVVVTLVSDPGMIHIRGGNESIQVIDFLPPGQPRKLDAAFMVQREGQLCVNATIQSQDQVLTAQKACIQGLAATPKRPSLKLQIDSASRQGSVPVGEEFTMVWSVINDGQTPLRSPIVSIQHDPNLEVLALSQGVEYQRERQTGRWRLTDMTPNGRVEFSGRFRGLSPAAQASVNVQVDTADGISERRTLTIGIGPGNASTGSPNNLGPAGGNEVLPSGPAGNLSNPIRSGFGSNTLDNPKDRSQERQLSVTIIPISNSIRRGEVGSFEIRVENLQAKPHQQVSLKLQLPESATLKSLRAKDLRYKLTDQDRQIDFEPIHYFRGNEVFSCVVELRVDQATASELVASVSSLSQPTPSLNRLSIQAVP